MEICPKCDTLMNKETKELFKGVFSEVSVCPSCQEGWFSKILDGENDALFLRKAFRAGGSLAVRLPKEIVNTLGISEGSELNFKVYPQGIFIKVNGLGPKRP